MMLQIRPAEPDRLPDFAGVVDGIDLSKPTTPDEVAAITAGMDKFAVLIFHDQHIDDAQQLAFSRHFGLLEQANADIRRPEERRLDIEVADVSNLGRNNQILARDDRRRLFSLGNMLWHSDSSFKPTPAKYSLLHARILPGKGGNTEFADMRAAYDTLDDETRGMCRDLVCMHSQIYSRGTLGFAAWTEDERARNQPVPQRLVRRHPGSGRRSLFLSAHAGEIIGWPVPEARAFLRDLNEHATQRKFVFAQEWRVGDLVMWDNRCMMHRARRYDSNEVRELHRTTVADSAPTLQQAA
ncbi:MAG TPA: TauD/TfdA family dioxygenase [Stellaceae bacterium]|jgi:alpha-ketoglutarate-dependent 2,4-dichlorophenoxyacetate dioxygenase|nr:TauD/TfdA family dioxygenase [Stellaceae bacterium]